MGQKVARPHRITCERSGGVDYLSEAQRSLIRRAATIEIELEFIEGQLSEGKKGNLTAYATASGHLRRILSSLGITRQPRDVTRTVTSVLQHQPSDDYEEAE
jgi:hypothetical protein